MVAKEIIVQGLVQGVGWRYHCLKVANNFNVSGYVKNETDGSVRIVVEGNEISVNNFINYLKSSNYPGYVKSWKISNIAYTGKYPDFRVKY